MTPSPPKLLVCLPILPNESIASFVQRHCAANAVLKVGDVLRLMSVSARKPVRSLSALVRDDVALSALEELTRSTKGALQGRLLRPLDGALGPLVRQDEHEWSEDARISPHQAICPFCLGDEGYGREEWEFVQAPVCSVHRVALVDRCHICSSGINALRTSPLHCGGCGASLAEAPTYEVTVATLRAAQLVQSTITSGLGLPGHTSPITPRDLSELLRLCLLPPEGARATFGLQGALHQFPIKMRLAALEAVGNALTGRSIDAMVLRRFLLKRWPHAPLLSPSQQRRLLVVACQEVGMLRDVTNLVCDGRDDLEPETAVRLFGLRVPSLQTRREVAAFLRVAEAVLTRMEQLGVFLTRPLPGYGYDMDEILSLRRALDDAHLPKDVDGILGIPGLAERLIHAEVLQSIRMGQGMRIHADSVTSLFNGFYRAGSGVAADTVKVRFGDWAERCGSLELVTAAVIWLLGGSLGVAAWDAPFRLVDLWVDQARLAELDAKRAASHKQNAA
ncbi:TniQ family protein [Rhizobacter fulvus]